MDDDHLMETAVRAAREAGQLAVSRLGNPGFQKWKGAHNIQAGASLEIQQRIVDIIHAEFPDHVFLLEESDEMPVFDLENPPHLWIVDPIDGSLNFYQGIPFFAISIAYREEGQYKLGVVYDPCRDELFQAMPGRGAKLNGKTINVEQLSDGVEAFDRAMLGMDFPSDLQRMKETLNITTLTAQQVLGIVVMGSPALGLCYIAAGRLHGYYHLQLNVWDVAAAQLILTEGGGILTDGEGGSWLFSDGSFIATNTVIHGRLLRAVKSVLQLRNPQV